MTTIMRRTLTIGGAWFYEGETFAGLFFVVFRLYSGHTMTVGVVANNNNQRGQFLHLFIACRREYKGIYGHIS